ncbi:MAG: PfkB family carbohydrate kinase, partial [Dehalococcoidia bacterium]
MSLAAAQYARSRGVRVIWDPAPARDMPKDFYAAVDVLTPNQTEAAYLSGIEVANTSSAQAAAQVLLSRGAPVAVVKMG